MFVRECRDVAAPAALVQERLADALRTHRLHGAARDAVLVGERALTPSSADLGAPLVFVDALPSYQRGPAVVTPIRWSAAEPADGTTASLDADIEVGPTTDGKTSVAVVGSYRPPVAAGADPYSARVIEAGHFTICSFLDRIAHELEDPSEPDGPQAVTDLRAGSRTVA
jgi:hypothetical protein